MLAHPLQVGRVDADRHRVALDQPRDGGLGHLDGDPAVERDLLAQDALGDPERQPYQFGFRRFDQLVPLDAGHLEQAAHRDEHVVHVAVGRFAPLREALVVTLGARVVLGRVGARRCLFDQRPRSRVGVAQDVLGLARGALEHRFRLGAQLLDVDRRWWRRRERVVGDQTAVVVVRKTVRHGKAVGLGRLHRRRRRLRGRERISLGPELRALDYATQARRSGLPYRRGR